MSLLVHCNLSQRASFLAQTRLWRHSTLRLYRSRVYNSRSSLFVSPEVDSAPTGQPLQSLVVLEGPETPSKCIEICSTMSNMHGWSWIRNVTHSSLISAYAGNRSVQPRAQKTRLMKLKMQIKLPMKAKSPYWVMLFSCKGHPLRSTDLMGLAVTWKSPPIIVVDHDDKNEGLRITAALPNTVCVNPRPLSWALPGLQAEWPFLSHAPAWRLLPSTFYCCQPRTWQGEQRESTREHGGC